MGHDGSGKAPSTKAPQVELGIVLAPVRLGKHAGLHAPDHANQCRAQLVGALVEGGLAAANS